ncbi:MAG: TonB-dependent receptor [Myxococcota bacterium]
MSARSQYRNRRIASTASILAVLTFLGAPLLENEAVAAPATTKGASSGLLKGVIRDKSGKGIPGANVVLDCTCLQDVRITSTNGSGLYRFKNLPVGLYTIQAVSGQKRTVEHIELTRGANEQLDIKVDGARENVTTIRVKKKPIKKTPGSVIEFSGKEVDLVAGGGAERNAVSGAIAMSSTGGKDAGGDTVAGATSAEMNYVVDGLRTNDIGSGMATLDTVNEFIGAVEVLEAGYAAEHGQASGGQVSARRVAGAKKVRGVARFTFTPRLTEQRTIVGTDDAIRAVETPDWGMQGVVRASGPFVGENPQTELGKKLKDKLFWVGGIVASGSRATLLQTYHHRVDKNQSGGYDQCPYENGAGDCEDGQDYLTTEQFASQKFPTRTIGGQALMGLDYFFTPKHRLAATMRVQPQFQRRAFRRPLSSIDPDSLGANPNATIGGASTVANGIVNDHLGWDRGNAIGGSLEYGGRVANDSIEIDATLGFLQTKYEEAWMLDNPEHYGTPSTQYTDGQGKNLFELLDNEGRLADVPRVTESCNDSNLPGLTCPVRSWVAGGLGQYSRETGRRIQADFALTHFFNAAGAHQLKYGSQFEHLARKRTLQYSGTNEADFYNNCDPGEIGGGEYCFNPASDSYEDRSLGRVNNNRQIFVGSNDPNNRRTRGFGRVQREQGSLRAIADPLGNGARVAAYDSRVSTQNYGVFLQDRWAITDALFVDAGVRWEMQDMRDILGRPAIRIWDNFAPRVGLVYDWTQEGKSRLFANYGWFYQQMPLSLINRVYGGLVDVQRTYQHSGCQGNTVNGPDGLAREQTVRGQPTEYCPDFGEVTTGLLAGATVPRLKGQYDQAFQVGYQHEIIEDFTLEVKWLHRDLGRAVEDISTDGGNNFIVANPGVAVGPQAIANQRAACDALHDQLEGMAGDEVGYGVISREANRCDFLVDSFEKVDTLFDKPKRTYDAFSLQAVKRWGDNWMLVGSYTFARNIGNYGGFVDPNTGAVNVGASSQYDLPELVRNSFGPLPGDVRHRVNLSGAYRFDMKDAGALSVGGSVIMQSGQPVSVRAGHNRYPGVFPTHIVPRGLGGRLQPNYQINSNIEYAYPIGDTMALGVAVRFFNLTNAKATLRVDDVYSFQNTRPIAGGEVSDLKHAKIQDPGRPTEHFQRDIVQQQGNYQVETAFQLPLTAQFDVRLNF